MTERSVRYYFGRFNLIANFEDKRDFILKGLQVHKFIEFRGYNWGFFEIIELNSEFGPFIHGFLVKYRPSTEEEVAVPQSHRLTLAAIANRVIAKARFFLNIESGLIAYHPVGNQIPNSTFCERFVRIFEEAHRKFFINAEIQAIEEQYRIFEAIKKFSSIARVFVALHPSNPSNIDRWKRIDERLKKIGASNYNEQYEANIEIKSLTIEGDEELTNKIYMAEDGYGRADITGNIEGEYKTISTKDNPITSQAPGDDEPPENVLVKLNSTIKNILKRFKK
jgi:hypothetical protein